MSGPVVIAGPTLETLRFRLSPFDESDLTALAGWLSQGRVARGFGRRAGSSDVAAARRWAASCDGRTAMLLAIRSAAGVPGGFWHVRPEARHRRAEVAVVVGARVPGGRAAAVETGIALFRWLFHRGVEKLTADVHAENRTALRLADVWMTREALLREEIRLPGTVRRGDVVRYGLLARDWPETLRRNQVR